MDLNVSVPATSELFEDNDIVFPVLLGRENLKILASPGSESSGVSSLDADEAAKKSSGSSPIMVSEPSSAVQTEGETSDGGSDGDDEKPTEQNQIEENVQNADDNEKLKTILEISDANLSATDGTSVADDNVIDDDNGNDDTNVEKEQLIETAVENVENPIELVASNVVVAPQPITKPIYEMPTIDEIQQYDNLKVMYEGRDILDLTPNIVNKSWNIQFAVLPDKNYPMYITNRSQYNRLAPGYERPTNYTLHECPDCGFNYPVMDSEIMQKAASQHACKYASELLTQSVPTYNNTQRDSPNPNLSAIAQKINAQTMPSTMHMNGQSLNLNNLMFNNIGNSVNANGNASANPTYAYQNRNQFGNMGAGSTSSASAAAAAAAAQLTANNQNGYKQNGNNNSAAYYGNNNMMINALANQIGNTNFMNAINGTTNNNTTNQLTQHQLNNAALANLMHQNRQQQQQQQQVSNYGFGRNPQQNNNKSGINYNNSHKQMPTYSHF